MIPITIAKLAKRHKRLKKELVEKFALSYDQMETMDAVDLVLDGIVKLKDREKKNNEMKCCPNCGSIHYTLCEPHEISARCNSCDTEWVQVIKDGLIVERRGIITPC